MTSHRRTRAIAVDEEYEAARVAVDLREHRFVAVGQTRRRIRVEHEYATQKLPNGLEWLDN